jgi:prepilin-type N-terminal cleavage/methylation domain-containing protein
MKPFSKIHNDHRGFTMIEIIAVLIVLFIFSTVVLTTYMTITKNKVMEEIDGLKANFCFAQIKALSNADDSSYWGISFISGSSSYKLVYTGVTTSPVYLPSEVGSDPSTRSTHNLPSGMTITGSAVNFDKWGRPLDGSGNLMTGDTQITLTSGTDTSKFNVSKNTGFIYDVP